MEITKYIVDTSVIAKIFLAQPDREIAIRLFSDAADDKIVLISPSLMLNELNNVFVKSGVPYERIIQNFEKLEEQILAGLLKIEQNTKSLLIESARIASLDNQGAGFISSYDATFHALALQLDAIYVTSDKKHFNKTSELLGSILLLNDYS